MLVIGRKRDEKLIIGGNIEITILKVGRNHVKFGVVAPREIEIQTRVDRGEATQAAAGAAGAPSASKRKPDEPRSS